MSNRIIHAGVAIALIALAALAGQQPAGVIASTATDSPLVAQAPGPRAFDPAGSARIDVVKTTVSRTTSSSASGDRILGSGGLLIPPIAWQLWLERSRDAHRVDHNSSGHEGRAPPAA